MPSGTPLILAMVLISTSQYGMADYLATIPLFWRHIYPNGGVSLYCGEPFARGDRRYNIEHVFPMSWVARSLGCGERATCRARNAEFNRIEADMHNMYPADKQLNAARGSMPYSLLKGERRLIKGCDLEIDERKRRVEPRPAVRGDVARAMLYMADRYQLKLHRRDMLLDWHRTDPPDEMEKRRNRRIEKLQGHDNPWISRANQAR